MRASRARPLLFFLTLPPGSRYNLRSLKELPPGRFVEMKVLSSLKSAKNRSKDCKIVRRKGRVYVICKSDPKLKARQG